MTAVSAARDEPAEAASILARSVAFVWFATGVSVLHPYYRDVGARYLDRIGMPHWTMPVTCALELAIAWLVATRPPHAWLTALQVGLVAGFTAILGVAEPMLLVHPFGVLSKNLPLVAALIAALWLAREGFSPRATWLLRAGVASIWITEGLFPKILFQQPMEIAVVEHSGLVPVDPAAFLHVMGGLQAASGIAALVLRGRPLRWLLAAQAVALVFLPLLVSLQDPRLWVHPFGPLVKNVPILAGTVVLIRRCSSSR